MGRVATVLISSVASGALQIATWLLGWWVTGTGNIPQPAISLGSTWTSVIIELVGKLFGPGLASMSWLPTAVNLVGGWIVLGLALIGLIALFRSLLTALIIVALVAVLVVLVFGLHVPVNQYAFPSTNSTTTIIEAFFH